MLSDYIQLEYIESTGTQYIDTEITSISKKLKVEIKFAISTLQNFQNLFCCRNSTYNSRTLFITDLTGFRNDQNYNQFNISKSLTLDTIYNLSSSQTEFKINNIVLQTYPEDSGIDLDKPLILLSAYDATTTIVNYNYSFKGKIYNYKIYDNDVLIRDYIPVKRKSDEVLGLYDMISNKFFINKGTGNFEEGEESTKSQLQKRILDIQSLMGECNDICRNIYNVIE